MMERTVLAGAVEELAPRFSGRLLQAGDDGYDEARMVWNGMYDRRPALMAQFRRDGASMLRGYPPVGSCYHARALLV
jgi:hypothetical protein